METLFRFVLARPAIVQREEAPSIRLLQDSQFQLALAEAGKGSKPREALKAVARQYVQGKIFLCSPKLLPLFAELQKLNIALAALEPKAKVSNAEVVKVITDSFGVSPADLIKNKTLDPIIAALRDSIIAIKQLPEEHHCPIEDLANQLRDLELIANVSAVAAFPGTGAILRRYRRRSLLLPGAADLRSALSTQDIEKQKEKERQDKAQKNHIEAEKLLDLYRRLGRAIEELTSLSSDHLQTTPQKPSAGYLVPAGMRPLQVFMSEMAQSVQLLQLNLLKAQVSLGKGEGSGAAEGGAKDVRALGGKGDTRFQTGTHGFHPVGLSELSFRLKASAEGSLSESTRQLLKERKLSVTDRPLDEIVAILRREMIQIGNELDGALGRPNQVTFKRIGSKLIMISTPKPSAWNEISVGATKPLSGYSLSTDYRVPTTHGEVAPAGIGDLLVVKQQLVAYEATDVAHIESILKGERKEREHTRRRETEELTLRESEITTSEERELESTNRFEMSRETSETIKEDATLKAGLSVSGKYGPTVEFSANAEGSLSRSKEEATKTAAKFSQDVTQRSSSKVTERVLQRESLRVTNEVTEKNSHLLDNVGGGANISGVYQWVNKVYQAQVFNYGLRTLYDFMVPEPAAYLIAALEQAHAHATELKKPAPFALRPDQITETNYYSWVLLYGATDVTAPPEMYKTKSLDFKAGGGDEKTEYNHSAQVQIDEGYRAVYGTVGAVNTIWEDNFSVDVVLGSRTHRIEGGDWLWGTTLDGEQDSLPFALQTWKVASVAVAAEVKCQRTDRALLKWKFDTHAKLMQAYKARLEEYEKKLAAIEAEAGIIIQGRSPASNLQLMKDEVQKNCISILTQQHFDLFDAIDTGSNGLPQIDVDESDAEGAYVRFFEQAFEWEHITWLAYPYFWGRKTEWESRIAYEDSDPIFNQFLKAGYCRVVVPARPGFEGAIDHFMTYGEVWRGGPLPPISSPLYLPIADEIAESLDRPGDETPEGDPWLVRIPTTLVHLRPDDKLPEWEKRPDGTWQPK